MRYEMKYEIKKDTILACLLIFITAIEVQSSTRCLDYDEVRNEGGFNSPSMKNVAVISRSDKGLTSTELQDIVQSTSLSRLHTFDLSYQDNLTDDYMRQLANNLVFSRLSKIILTGSHHITDTSVQAILDGLIGTIRDLPQTSGEYGIPSTTVNLRVNDTGVKQFDTRKRFGVTVKYRPPNPQVEWSDSKNAVKLIEMTY